MFDVPVVFLADVFHQFVTWQKTMAGHDREGIFVGSRVVDGDFLRHGLQAGPSVALNSMKLLGVWMAHEVKPEQVVVADSIDDQGIAVPTSRRMPVPGGVRNFRVFASVHENLTKAVYIAFEEHIEIRRALDDL